ncbi:MAG: nucleotidyltransferase domain-containing protein [Desulfobacteraceae bacterium]|nr:MAG: nucleotidyltransferase domain-containing protein [Desulfobacteraceae bacterium]
MSIYEEVLKNLREACLRLYKDRMVSLVVFGSVGRGFPKPDSDIDILIVAEDLPDGRIARVREFGEIEDGLSQDLDEAAQSGVRAELSPVFKSPAEVKRGSPLFLDMVHDGRILYDRDKFIENAFASLEARLNMLGAKRVWKGDAWYWDLKPDYQPGEVFEI